jgi:hypothetical protein
MKNRNRLYAMFACANLYMLAMAGRSFSEGIRAPNSAKAEINAGVWVSKSQAQTFSR